MTYRQEKKKIMRLFFSKNMSNRNFAKLIATNLTRITLNYQALTSSSVVRLNSHLRI